MDIRLQLAIITFIMALGFMAPKLSKRVQEHSRILLLVGTGGLVSLYFGDLLPDVLKLGGIYGLAIIASVWLFYTFFHGAHSHEHDHVHEHPHPHLLEDGHDHDDGHVHVHAHLPNSSRFLMVSMISHCFSSGMLLYASHELSTRVAASVFLAIVGHKGYEALSVSILLSQRVKARKVFFLCGLAYTFSLSLGLMTAYALKHFLGAGLSPDAMKMTAMVVASIAVGSLAGCMVNDFIIPSVRHLRTRVHETAWVLIGVGLTIVFIVGAPG